MDHLTQSRTSSSHKALPLHNADSGSLISSLSFNSTATVSLTNSERQNLLLSPLIKIGRPLAFLRMTLAKISLTLDFMKLCYALACPFYSRIRNFYIYFHTLPSTPNLQTPNNENIFNNRKWKNTDIGVKETCTITGDESRQRGHERSSS